MQGEPSVLVRLAAIEAALATRSGLVRFRLATGGGLALILERWLLWAQQCAGPTAAAYQPVASQEEQRALCPPDGDAAGEKTDANSLQ